MRTRALEVTVDLRSTTICWADETAPFVIDDYTKWRLLEGSRRRRPHLAT